VKRAHLIGALITVGLLGLFAWVAANTYWDTERVPGILRGPALTDPYYAAGRYAALLGARLERLEDPLASLPGARAVLWLSDLNLDFEPERRVQLERWVAAGGHLVLDLTVTLSDRELARWTGLRQQFISRQRDEATADDAGAAAPPPRPPVQPCMRYAPRHAATADGDFLPSARLRTARRPDFDLGDADGLQVVRVPLGRGSVTLLNAREPFDNRGLLQGDHARLFATVMRLHPGAVVWLIRGGERLTLAGLLLQRGAAVLLLLGAALALLLWRAAVRFGPVLPAPPPLRRSLRAQIAGTAEFLRSHGASAALWQASAQALEAAIRHRVPGYGRLRPEEQAATLARLTGLPQGELFESLHGAGRAGPDNLARRVALLERARRRLQHRQIFN